jgi:hypothetical protein
MGLDITAYGSAVLTDEHPRAGVYWCENEGHQVAWTADDDAFVRSWRGLVLGRCYDTSAKATLSHRAGSYGGHNRIRRALAEQFIGVEPEQVWRRPADYVDAPFYELVNFADNEGTIGPLAAADLAADFAAHRDAWRTACPGDWEREVYDRWHQAFAYAADGGMVVFR